MVEYLSWFLECKFLALIDRKLNTSAILKFFKRIINLHFKPANLQLTRELNTCLSHHHFAQLQYCKWLTIFCFKSVNSKQIFNCFAASFRKSINIFAKKKRLSIFLKFTRSCIFCLHLPKKEGFVIYLIFITHPLLQTIEPTVQIFPKVLEYLFKTYHFHKDKSFQ